jgi:hypothetical protein
MSDNEKMIDASFEVRFTVPLGVRSINDALINEQDVIKAAKSAARNEVIRQLSAAMEEGQFDVGY